MGDSIAVRLLLAFFTSSRTVKGKKGIDWCERYIGGMHAVLGRWEDGIAPKDNDGAKQCLLRYCRACGLCHFSETRPVITTPSSIGV